MLVSLKVWLNRFFPPFLNHVRHRKLALRAAEKLQFDEGSRPTHRGWEQWTHVDFNSELVWKRLHSVQLNTLRHVSALEDVIHAVVLNMGGGTPKWIPRKLWRSQEREGKIYYIKLFIRFFPFLVKYFDFLMPLKIQIKTDERIQDCGIIPELNCSQLMSTVMPLLMMWSLK